MKNIFTNPRSTAFRKSKSAFFSSLFLVPVMLTIFLFAVRNTPAASGLDSTFNAGVTRGDAEIYVTKALADGKILVGGSFASANDLPKPYLARLNADGTTDPTFNAGNSGPNKIVSDIAEQADGKFIIGGEFTEYNGVPRTRLARINADGSLDPTFNPILPNSNRTAYRIAIQNDGKILVAGEFAGSIIRLNADGSVDSSFTSPYSFPGLVFEIAIQPDGKILVGGTLFNNLDRLNEDGSKDSSFTLNEEYGDIYDIKILSAGKVLIGGSFLPDSNDPEPSVARLKSDGTTDETFSTYAANVFNFTKSMAIQPDGKILAAGIHSDNGISTLALIRLNANGGVDNLFSIPAGDNQSFNVTLQADGKILLSGVFSKINGESKPGIVRLNADGSIDNSFHAAFYEKSVMFALKQQPDGKILAGGTFNFANGTVRSDIVRFNPDGTLDPSFDTGTGLNADFITCCKQIMDIETQADGKILLAGVFNGYNGIRRRGMVRLNPDGTIDPTFNLFLEGGSMIIYDTLVLPDGKIMVSAFSTNFDGFASFDFFRVNSDGSLDTFFQVADGVITKIARQPDGKILVGGTFADGLDNFNRIKRYNTDGSPDPSFNIGSGFNSTVGDLVIQPDGKILVVGGFTSFNGTPVNRIARLHPNGSLDTSFSSGSSANASIRKIVVLPDGRIVIGGEFTSVNGVERSRVAVLRPSGALDPAFDSGLDNTPTNAVRSLLVQADGKLLIGGNFQTYAGVSHNSIARVLVPSSPAPYDFDGDRKTDLSIFRPSNGQWWYQRSSDGQVPAAAFGSGTDKIVPSDFTGDGKSDIAVWRPASGEWFILRSEDGSFFSTVFGQAGDTPLVGDFDADGKSDIGVFRNSTGEWFVQKSSGGFLIVTFGTSGDRPVPADYDGDGKADVAIFRPSDGSWWHLRSSDLQYRVYVFGVGTDKPVQGDYTGDGKADIAFWRPLTGEWFIQRSEDNSFLSVPFGTLGDIPSPGDYDGDGKFDLAVFRPADANWYVQRTTAGLMIQQFGLGSDMPVPSAFVP
jgi:uncharacterized delta-60 repeat protein